VSGSNQGLNGDLEQPMGDALAGRYGKW